MGIVRSYVKPEVAENIQQLRDMVDRWNSLSNKSLTNETFDFMLNHFSDIKLFRWKNRNDAEFNNEVLDNSNRYLLENYFVKHSKEGEYE